MPRKINGFNKNSQEMILDYFYEKLTNASARVNHER